MHGFKTGLITRVKSFPIRLTV